MNILKVKFQLQDGWEGIDAFLSRMYAFGRLAIVQQSDMFVKMCFPFLSVDEYSPSEPSAFGRGEYSPNEYSPDECSPSGRSSWLSYRQLWLFALRHFPVMDGQSPRRDKTKQSALRKGR